MSTINEKMLILQSEEKSINYQWYDEYSKTKKSRFRPSVRIVHNQDGYAACGWHLPPAWRVPFWQADGVDLLLPGFLLFQGRIFQQNRQRRLVGICQTKE